MKTATVRHLRNHYSAVLRWIDAGEEVSISRRGKVVARLVPETARKRDRVDWTTSAAARMDKSLLPRLSAKEVAGLLAENRGDH
jgi:antitoxin (DNA-binding transcriptional repressor) of toxin-antitoxin stability system